MMATFSGTGPVLQGHRGHLIVTHATFLATANIISVGFKLVPREVTKMSMMAVDKTNPLEGNAEQESNFKMDKLSAVSKTGRCKMLSFENVYLFGLTVRLIYTLFITNAILRSLGYDVIWTGPNDSMSESTTLAIDVGLPSAAMLCMLVIVVIMEKMGAFGNQPSQAFYCVSLFLLWIGSGLFFIGSSGEIGDAWWSDRSLMMMILISFFFTASQWVLWMAVCVTGVQQQPYFTGRQNQEVKLYQDQSRPLLEEVVIKH